MCDSSRNNGKQDRNCSVCMEEDLPLQKLAITPCAHTFCVCLSSLGVCTFEAPYVFCFLFWAISRPGMFERHRGQVQQMQPLFGPETSRKLHMYRD